MPHKSIREIRQEFRRRRTDRYLDLLLSVVAPDGSEVLRTGGRWDRHLRRWAHGADVAPRVFRLEQSQVESARGFAAWMAASRAGDPTRPIVLMLAGDRGSGKTHELGLFFVACGIEFPGEVQFGVSITAPQRREVIQAIKEIAAPEWIEAESEDLRDPWLRFPTKSTIYWVSSRNPARLRQAKFRIRHVGINEAQDQPEDIFVNGVGATRGVDGLTTIATNRPRAEGFNWVATAANEIEAGKINGLFYLLDPKLNSRVSGAAIDKRAAAVRAVSREAADADYGGGGMKLSGPMAYPAFRALPFAKGGHVGDPPPVTDLGPKFWIDITRQLTAEKMGGGDGFDWVIGCDWQFSPGIVGIACKFFRVEREWPDGPLVAREPDGPLLPLPVGTLVMWAGGQVNVPGDESAFADALERAGYSPHGLQADQVTPAPRALLVGDATGATQNAKHRWEEPPSFHAMRSFGGWTVIPPTWTRNRKPDNPRVRESRTQVHAGFEAGQLIVSPSLKEPEEGFASLIDGLMRAQVGPKGGLKAVGGWQHPCDGFRYPWFCFGPRSGPPQFSGTDTDTQNAIRRIRVLTNG